MADSAIRVVQDASREWLGSIDCGMKEAGPMRDVDIQGTWLSKAGRVYIITQIGDRFVWQVVHSNGITETGIGSFPNVNENNWTDVEARWNFHSGASAKGHESNGTKGKVILRNGKVTKVEWKDYDHFVKRLP